MQLLQSCPDKVIMKIARYVDGTQAPYASQISRSKASPTSANRQSNSSYGAESGYNRISSVTCQEQLSDHDHVRQGKTVQNHA